MMIATDFVVRPSVLGMFYDEDDGVFYIRSSPYMFLSCLLCTTHKLFRDQHFCIGGQVSS